MCKLSRIFFLLLFIFLYTPSIAQDNINDTVIIPADTAFKASFLKKFLFGTLYRDVWLTPIKARVVKLDTLKGGLKAVELGGGQQTKNLRLMDKDGNIYALRSVQKFPDKALPEQLRFPPITFLVKDQISASMPYGALILPPMEAKTGINHTNPKLYYVTDDPVLEEHKDIFEGTLVLFEERPEDFNEPVPSFGLTDNWIETDNMQDEREESLRHVYNERRFLKSRLFDIIIGDWDRHEGQWDWGIYEKGDITYYEPVPLDRDNAFYNFDGFIPWFFSRNWALPKFQLYQPHISNVVGFNYNARYVDRYFLNELELEDWIEIADNLKMELDDQIVADAIKFLPDTIYSTTGQFLETRILSRRDEIKKAAIEYYYHLAEKVNVIGSDANDLFEINILDKETVQVLLFEYLKGERSIDTFYNRTFKADETDEVRLYGMNGEDKYVFNGQSHSDIKVRIIGGADNDSVITPESWEKKPKNIYSYDYPNSITVAGTTIKSNLTSDSTLIEYDFEQYRRDYFGPTGSFGYNKDHGFYLTAGISKKVRGFDIKYISEQSLTATFEFGINSGRIDYSGIFRKVLADRIGFSIFSHYLAPGYKVNFFGFGNETNFDRGIHYYRVPLHQFNLQPMIDLPFGDNFTISFGPEFEYTKVEADNELINGYVIGKKNEFTYTGAVAAATITTLDNLVFPEKGIVISAEAKYLYDLINENDHYEINGDAAIFFNIQKLIFGIRAGAETNSSTYPFFRSPTLGSNKNLRGFRHDRFFGQSIAYQNTDLRYKIVDMAGLIIFNDFGKAFTPLVKSDKWHHSYGIGLYIAPEKIFSLTATYAISKEENLFDLSFGFFF